jgi:hypothetical protein
MAKKIKEDKDERCNKTHSTYPKYKCALKKGHEGVVLMFLHRRLLCRRLYDD